MAVVRWGSATHEGMSRDQNEDHHHVGEGLYVVADGMGGHLAGEIASEMAVTRLRERLPVLAENSLDDLVSAINEANVEIYNGSVENADQAGMGTTVIAIANVVDPHDGEVLAIANVGDSRGYVFRHNRLRQLTIDHSFVQELVAEGAISRDEARTHPRRNIVTRALGIEPYVRVDSWTMPIIRGDRYVLCSDGLIDEITDEEITAVLLDHPDDPDAAAQALVDAANDAGGRDNITVVIVDVVEGDDPPDPTEEFDVIPMWSDDDLDTTGETQIVADPPDVIEDESHAAEPGDASDSEDDDTSAVASEVDAATVEALAALANATPETQIDDEAQADASGDASGDASEPSLPAAAPTEIPSEAAPSTPRRRLARVARFGLAIGVASVVILGFAILAAWARSGYYVAFNDADEVVIFQGRDGGVLWFEPTEESRGQFTRDELDDDSIDLVEQRLSFESQASAELFVAERLTTAEPDG